MIVIVFLVGFLLGYYVRGYRKKKKAQEETAEDVFKTLLASGKDLPEMILMARDHPTMLPFTKITVLRKLSDHATRSAIRSAMATNAGQLPSSDASACGG